MTKHPIQSTSALWARFRFSVVGSLLSSPPARGELKAAIESLAAKTWTHPVTGRDVRFAAKTIERWFYRARHEQDDPVGVLRQAVRKDCGKVSLKPALIECLAKQYHDYPHWTYQLHYDNLKALVKADETTRSAPVLLHGAAVHGGSGHGAQATSEAEGTPGRTAGGPAARTARDPQLRGRVRGLAVAPRLPSWLAQGGHATWPVGAAVGFGHPGRSLAALLPPAVVSVRDHRGSRAWPVPGNSEVRSAPGLDERQRFGHAGGRIHARGCYGSGFCTRRRFPTAPIKTESKSVSGRISRDA